MNQMNPLSKYTKVETLYTKLVSNDVIKYPAGVLVNNTVECGICARSARDELMFNNPDALMNGEAVVNVIQNCVPNIANARELFVPDVELLLIGIKLATKETEYQIEVNCPECDHHGAFERNLQYLIDSAELIEEQPTLVLEDVGGLMLKFKPHTWKEHSEFGLKMFQEQKKAQLLEGADLSDDDKIKQFTSVFESMTQLSFDMIVANIESIETVDQIVVTEREFINDWLGKQPAFILKQIREKSDYINNVGVTHEMDVGCSKCGHEWKLENLQFDPSSFFVSSFSSQNQTK
ncbi:Lead, cadmium, zinc and mercury transporting ATPase; Copper-translocating P-type ATPase [Yersinia phage fHe-Yen9-04]|uniref:Lead, cadmium, zinc and mercury transporting ATPase Copper-translocating P-type ATPase n=2 Tax=Eneladusvirus Yen904 TaxID=2560849 RepID=A0A2C9CXH4_9CAUD|nr:Lead, cadmium, zinc and mercury transporting ATPase; Copper-translocating P-type ATPase [Yersinia phage fHe-Yen9-04]SOK58520.1 Lead, cadmium, zinc and mercury transporting ATPase; Copper-translocating P-type ATPase [Yersinia phage fHe-Yen9-04]SOK59054.1 Lead, cadmium, zinc and mercury transporting ATPase; Copper-translocating P-type ATPase [Yersinia phage fHe-Yen9-03]VUE36289.1 Lead, cadmium, zinc and mercury transporting ATPase; Copper-translocating P-type ATPase [Yersinia phage fHe-Yen9-04]